MQMKKQNQNKVVSKDTLCSSIAELIEQGKSTITLQDIASQMNIDPEAIKKDLELVHLYNNLVRNPISIASSYYEYKFDNIQNQLSYLEKILQQYFRKKEMKRIASLREHCNTSNGTKSRHHNYGYDSDDDYRYHTHFSDPWESIHEQQDREDQERFESAVNDLYDLLDTMTNGYD